MDLLLPDFLDKNFRIAKHIKVDMDSLYVGVKNIDFKSINYVKVINTPHYRFVSDYLIRNKIASENLGSSYLKYINQFPDNRSISKFVSLIESIQNEGYQYDKSPILVFRTFPFQRLCIADGFHRLAILAALGNKSIDVVMLKRKQSFFKRLKQKF